MLIDKYYYWDSNLLLSYFNNESGSADIVEAILDRIRQTDNEKIITSVISKVEVAWIASEKENQALSPEVESKIDDLWNDSSIIELVEFNDVIALMARDFLRKAMSQGLGLKNKDAIHIATAKFVNASEMNTFDSHLYQYGKMFGLNISAPVAGQLKLL